MHRLTLLAALLAVTSTLMIPTTAHADDSDVSSQISYALQMSPGGVQRDCPGNGGRGLARHAG